jgi:hypothetical protein
MRGVEYRFQFSPDVDLAEAEDTLRLSLLAAEGLFGEARVRTEATFSVHPLQAELRVSGCDAIVTSVAQICTSLLTHELGRESFAVCREPIATSTAAAA